MFQALIAKRRSILLFTLLALSVLLAACNAQAQSTGSYATVPAGKAKPTWTGKKSTLPIPKRRIKALPRS